MPLNHPDCALVEGRTCRSKSIYWEKQRRGFIKLLPLKTDRILSSLCSADAAALFENRVFIKWDGCCLHCLISVEEVCSLHRNNGSAHCWGGHLFVLCTLFKAAQEATRLCFVKDTDFHIATGRFFKQFNAFQFSLVLFKPRSVGFDNTVDYMWRSGTTPPNQ